MTPQNFTDKPMPSSIEAEETILGSVLLDNDLMQQCAESLEVQDFYSPTNRRVFEGMLDLFTNQKPIDALLVGDAIRRAGNEIPSASIAKMALGLPHQLNIAEYIDAVRDKSNRRQLIRTCNAIVGNAYEGEDVFNDAQAQINDLCLRAETGSDEYFVPLHRVIDNEVFQALDDLRSGTSHKIKLGFHAIDAIVGGLAKSDVLLVAADTGAGKSAFALQAAYNIALQGIPTAFLAGEMTNKENVLRLLSQISGYTNLNWATHIPEWQYEGLIQYATSLKNTPIHFEHRISDMQTLRTHLRSIVRRYKVEVLVIDYIQLFKMEKVERRKRNERIAEASQETKRLANELGIGIIEVAQFNREGAKSVQAGLHDLEGSGQLEKDASLIFILELSDGEFSEAGRKYREVNLRIVKGRNVGKTEIPGKFYGSSVQFAFD
jgi:replicative DNA helicase